MQHDTIEGVSLPELNSILSDAPIKQTEQLESNFMLSCQQAGSRLKVHAAEWQAAIGPAHQLLHTAKPAKQTIQVSSLLDFDICKSSNAADNPCNVNGIML